MRWFGAVVCCLLLAGSIKAQRPLTGNAGKEVTFHVISLSGNVTSCHLTTPANKTLEFNAGQTSENDERYELLSAYLNDDPPSCSVVLKNLVESDSGIWEVAFIDVNGKGNSEKYILIVTPGDEKDDQDDEVTWLSPIEFPTRTGQYIDISLSKSTYPEDCYIRKPGGHHLMTADAIIEGVRIRDSSDFVSCRITIGPINETLLGSWALCGKRTDNSGEQDRCQLVRISWHNSADPDTRWSTFTQAKFDQAVNFGGVLAPVVLGSGSRISCHVITPKGEDLIVATDSEYPNISLVSSDSSRCNIAIGPIAASMLGEWTLYGKFRDFTGLREVRLPMFLFLYDENNPHDQAYNVTVSDPVKHAVNLGTTLNLEVTGIGKVDSCQFMTPSGERVDLDGASYEGASFVNVEGNTACRIAIGPLAKHLLGNWTVIGKFSNNGRFTEEQRTFEVLEEDPANPIIDEGRIVQNLTAQLVTTDIGKRHKLIIQSNIFVTGESCHIRTPDGLQYSIIDGFNVSGVEVIVERGVDCGVIVHVLSEDAVGTWTLISRASQSSQLIERRLPFTIVVEETVEAIPKEVTIFKGNDLYVRLASPTEQYDTCKLVAPTGAVSAHVVDPLHVQSCGYIVTNITASDNGTWKIIYGSRATYIATIEVAVIEISNDDTDFLSTIELFRDRSVNMTVGPKSAVYCRLEDPKGVIVFDGFGRCTLTIDKVTLIHHGTWRMVVATAGRVVAIEHPLYVDVKEAEGKPLVSTRVTHEQSMATVSCSLATDAAVRACKFRDPQGRVLLAAGGVAEDRYVFHGTESSYQSEVRTHECGLHIRNPLASDLGLWRCAIETEEDTYYGYLALLDSSIASDVHQEPILRAERVRVEGVEDEPVTMSCMIEATIRYCYFRAANGTTFSVSPGMTSPDMEYVGAGFDAGECGVRFHSMSHVDSSGHWGCHVGLVNDHKEQSDQFQLVIHEAMRVEHYHDLGSTIIVGGQVYEHRTLDYCRYVRIDGLGFSTDKIPSEYTDSSDLANGHCRLTIRHPTVLDLHPWTVVAKIRGQDVEISRDTMNAILIRPTFVKQTGMFVFLYMFMVALLISIFLGACLGPKKSREWTYNRASSFRRSIQRSFRKEPLPPQAPINQRA